jgi:hypothetical protein
MSGGDRIHFLPAMRYRGSATREAAFDVAIIEGVTSMLRQTSPLFRQTSPIRRLVFGFLAGALSVLLAHQVMVLALSALGLIQAVPYSMRAVPPLGIPTIANSVFWGGLWGVLFALIADRLPLRALWLKGLLFGLLGPLLANWFVVAPLKGQPVAGGFVLARMWPGVLILGAFGIGIALIYSLLQRRVVAR